MYMYVLYTQKVSWLIWLSRYLVFWGKRNFWGIFPTLQNVSNWTHWHNCSMLLRKRPVSMYQKRGKRKKKETPEFLMQPLPYVRVVGVVSKRHSFSPLMDSMVFCLSSAMWLCCKKSFSKLVSWVKARAATRFMLQFDRSRLTNCGIISKALDSTFWSGFRSKCKERR